jgi:predicted helicase
VLRTLAAAAELAHATREHTLALVLAGLQARAGCGSLPLRQRDLAGTFAALAPPGAPAPPTAVLRACVAALAVPAARRWGEGARPDAVSTWYEAAVGALAGGQRGRRGVYFTPPELVQLLVRSAGRALLDLLGEPAGLGSPRVVAIDLALGTGAFLECCLLSRPAGVPPARLVGLELCPVALQLARAALDRAAGDGGAQAALRCVDALADDAFPEEVLGPKDIPVVLGNPPWRGHSRNRLEGRRLGTHLEDYQQVGGRPLGERNPRWLQDDYVKFFRLAHAIAASRPRAVVALVTNHAYLDNPTFRGMRESLLADFDHLYALDLRGNRLRTGGRRSPPDGNLFPISQGVAATLLVRGGAPPPVRQAGTLHGTREAKLGRLAGRTLQALTPTAIQAAPPGFELTDRRPRHRSRFERGACVTEVFALHGPGVVTSRDALVVARTRRELQERLALLRDPAVSTRTVRARCGGVADTRAWSLADARRTLQALPAPPPLTRYLYRPLDRQWACLHPALVERSRRQVMQHLRGRDALALIAMRQVAQEGVPYSHVLVTDCPVDNRACYSNRGMVSVFPLLLHPGTASQRDALAPAFLERCSAAVGHPVQPLEVFDYVYGLLHAPGYRDAFVDCLALAFPRLPPPASAASFASLRGAGERLRRLHLGQVTPEPAAAGAPLAPLGGYTPEQILDRAARPGRARRILAETHAIAEGLRELPI